MKKDRGRSRKTNPDSGVSVRKSRQSDGKEVLAATVLRDESLGRSKSSLSVVGIGASAGGLEAFTRLASHLRRGTGLAYVLVQHLDPLHESLLPEILGRASSLPVLAAIDGMRIEPDHVYVIPPGASMTVANDHLRVVHRARAPGVHTVIDAFLDSLSTVYGSDAVGVILSGAGSDGSRGVEAVKERGGITIAQDTQSAQFPSMPDSAVATGCIDFVLAPEQIAEHLMQIGRLVAMRRTERTPLDDGQADLEKILLLIKNKTGVDFRHYRTGTVHRRVVRRMLARREETRSGYLAFLRANPVELDLLCADILIGVTHFFRDPEVFTVLQQTAFPEIMKERASGAPIRVWVAGCSSGEEAYSVAISVLEYLDATACDVDLQLFATDLSESAITRARAGLYPHRIEADVSTERLQRFFTREEGGYRITRRVRDVCVFARHNIVQDPPFSQLDLITCRNVLIYFDTVLQERAMQVFHYGLNPNGLLLLGAAESVVPKYFVPLDKRHKLFRPQTGSHRVFDITMGSSLSVIPSGRSSPLDPWRERPCPSTVPQDADRAVSDHLAPSGVVINERLEILQFRGDTTEFVQHPSGVASLHLPKLIRPEFLPRLRSAIDRAGGDTNAVFEEIALREGDSVRNVAITVIPFRSGPARERFFIVLFSGYAKDLPTDHVLQVGGERRVQHQVVVFPQKGADPTRDVARLREELAETKRYLQDVIEQYEAANEELRAASEEIQSSNEELRSGNEELETTKEEVQSTNEELTTVNDELRHRNRELAATSGDLANVFASTQVPIVIVDGTLSIRRFTPITERVMKIIATDVGRPLGDIKLRVDLADLEARVSTTIETLELSQADVRDDQGRWWALTIRPYLTVDRKIDGAVLVFTDINTVKKYGEQADKTSEHQHKLLLETEAARMEANTANLSKMAFLANMSHEFRTPLNAIAGYADLLVLGVHGALTPDQENDLVRIKRSSRHLLSLINDILNFTKISTGHLDLRIEIVAIADVVATLEAITFPQIHAKGLRLELVDCHGTVLADGEKLQQILLNLVTNAIKFTATGRIGIRCSNVDSMVRIEVSDTGVGISEGQLERIFEPFIQVDRSLTNVMHDGVGLGLSISRDLARAMGGDVSAESAMGQGSVFTVTLPSGG